MPRLSIQNHVYHFSSTSLMGRTSRPPVSSWLVRQRNRRSSCRLYCPTSSECCSCRSYHSSDTEEQRRSQCLRWHSLRPIQQTTHLEKANRVIRNSCLRIFRCKNKVITVVLHPPEHVAATDDVVEQEADEHPGHIVDWRCRRHPGNGRKGDWKIDVLQKGHPIFLVQSPLDKG